MAVATGSKRKPSLEAEPSRQRILDAALRLFAQHGYEGVSLQQIADAVGLHKATLFHHFDGKRELAEEVWEIVIQPLLVEVEALALPADASPEIEQLLRLMDRLVDYFAEQPFVARFLMRELVAPEDSPFHVDPHDMQNAVVRLLTIIWNWLERARRTRVIRQVNLQQTIFNLLGVMLFYPSSAQDLKELAGPDPFSPAARRSWKRDLRNFIHAALAPS